MPLPVPPPPLPQLEIFNTEKCNENSKIRSDHQNVWYLRNSRKYSYFPLNHKQPMKDVEENYVNKYGEMA